MISTNPFDSSGVGFSTGASQNKCSPGKNPPAVAFTSFAVKEYIHAPLVEQPRWPRRDFPIPKPPRPYAVRRIFPTPFCVFSCWCFPCVAGSCGRMCTCLQTIARIGFGKNVFNMLLDCRLATKKLTSDLAVGHPALHQQQHLDFFLG